MINIRDLFHSGVAHDENPPGRGSGRYPYGSGKNPGQHRRDFLSEYEKYHKQGMTDTEIAKILMGVKYIKKDGTPVYCTGTDLKLQRTITKKQVREDDIAEARRLLEECDGNVSEVGRRMGVNESTVRSWLDDEISANQRKYQGMADKLKQRIEESEIGAIDVSKYTELYAGCTEHTKKLALALLKEEGYMIINVPIPQADGKNNMKIQVLARKPGEGETEKDVYREIMQNKYKIGSIADFSPDGGETWWSPEFPESISSSRIKVRYDDDPEISGSERDGVIQIRRGCADLDLQGSLYAQVRIAVDGTHYMKGMAMYADDSEFPPGVDIIYNSNKKSKVPMIDSSAVYNPEDDSWSGKEVLKRMKVNPKTGEVDQDNPFGATIRGPKEVDGKITAAGQYHYVGDDGKEHLSPINKLQDEGDWNTWSKSLASQMLSKQPSFMVEEQTQKTLVDRRKELDEIRSLTNPVLRKKLLADYADNLESQASELSVNGFPRQKFQVLLPIPSLKDNEIYAPNFRDGEEVALIRYPHGGTFEIPILTVNNRNAEAKNVMYNAKDAVGINKKNADHLSGADFDGDTAAVIPIKGLKIKHSNYLPQLDGFDPKAAYKLPDDAPQVENKTKQLEMGKVTNLITDMSLHPDVTEGDIANAVRHSMVVIDSEKHHLDYKKSEDDNHIIDLKYRYQGTTQTGQPAGASTIVSRAGSEIYIPLRKEVTNTKIMTESELRDYNAGKKVYRNTGEKKLELIKDPSKMTEDELTRYNAGKKVFRESKDLKTTKVAQMDVVDDAFELVRDKNNLVEVAYANYANGLKSTAYEARAESRRIQTEPVSKAAKQVYAPEVESLNAKIRQAQYNKPKERQALLIGNAIYDQKIADNPNLDAEHRARIRAQAMDKGRAIVGAKKPDIDFTDSEWDAIQAGAISTRSQELLFGLANQDKLKQRAMPKQKASLSSNDIALIKAMKNDPNKRYDNATIAERVGCSVSMVNSIS